MVGPVLTQAPRLLNQAIRLRDQIREDIRTQQFGADDVNMSAYNDLIQVSANLFHADPVLNGGMIIMPDSVLQTYQTLLPIQSMPLNLPSTRLEAHLTQFINRLELLIGESAPRPSAARTASEVLQEEQGSEVRDILNALGTLRQQQPEPSALDRRDFAFILDNQLRDLLKKDFEEASSHSSS